MLLVSCMMLLGLLYSLCKDIKLHLHLPDQNGSDYTWHLDQSFVLVGVIIHVFSLCSSSMVEEEQYTWHFLTSTLYFVFLRATSQAIVLVLICGRILRAWHQGGVNWSHLPDISKGLESAGTFGIKSLQTVSLILVLYFTSSAFRKVQSRTILARVVMVSLFVSGFLILVHIMEDTTMIFNCSATSIAQAVYATLGITVILTSVASPWIIPIHNQKNNQIIKHKPDFVSSKKKESSLLMGIRDSAYLIGVTHTVCWCLLQLLLQQPTNSVPILLLLVQIMASAIYFSDDKSHHAQWIEVAAMYFLGMAGHFGLGNSNSLATVDVAGAFIGISSHSTVLSGILMFFITYASPLLFLVGMIDNADLGLLLQMIIGFSSLVPLVLNSIVLSAFTIILLLMRNHLFVWSVFSPKYLYVCAASISVYIGVFSVVAAVVYTCLVIFYRTQKICPNTSSLK
ncbi:hypothetical protein QJS04_geneDACA024820 [Acorus gramineus]|uniref:GPI ethanolamine phosphate transferase 2 C-terminal domain-containing protein n=1 Tax=Acorus gramineus TaxID=55184 RepID=A0AAV9BLU7_ACOGR|nr:hypothetical protein QJS04_geneDACA024820 [Acorus gramineus]